MSKIYELIPTDGRKSFYRKAMVLVADDGSETLFSYETKIITRTKEGKLIRHYRELSATTARHVKSFCGLNKKEFNALEVIE